MAVPAINLLHKSADTMNINGVRGSRRQFKHGTCMYAKHNTQRLFDVHKHPHVNADARATPIHYSYCNLYPIIQMAIKRNVLCANDDKRCIYRLCTRPRIRHAATLFAHHFLSHSRRCPEHCVDPGTKHPRWGGGQHKKTCAKKTLLVRGDTHVWRSSICRRIKRRYTVNW